MKAKKRLTSVPILTAALAAWCLAGLASAQEGREARRKVRGGTDKRRGREAFGRQPKVMVRLKHHGFVQPGRLNVIDQARYAIAALLIRDKKFAEAIEELQRIVEKSPSEETVAATRLNMGNIYLHHMEDAESAIEQ